MSVHDYSQFGLNWLHPGGCEHITTPRASCVTAWRAKHADDAPLEIEDDDQFSDFDKQALCAPYPGVFWSRAKQRFVVQFRHNFEMHWVGAYTDLEAALDGHDEYVLAQGIARKLYTLKDKSA